MFVFLVISKEIRPILCVLFFTIHLTEVNVVFFGPFIVHDTVQQNSFLPKKKKR